METEVNTRIQNTSAVTPWPHRLFKDATQFWHESEGLHHAYHVYRALRGDYEGDFKPDKVFYVGRSPAAYLKTVDEIREEDVHVWQRFLWNQAVVPILIVESRLKVRVYTAYTAPKRQDGEERIQAILEPVAEALTVERLLTAIEAGTIYEEKPEAFNRAQAVDRYLLENLNTAANRIAERQEGGVTKENLEFAHLFLMRVLFVCYLIERGMIKGKHFDGASLQELRAKSKQHEGYFLWHLFRDLGTYARRRDALCKIFAKVKEQFNGSLFPDSITSEKERYNENLIAVVSDFLQCQNLKDKQYVLDFWAYDFSVIPIETISAVYEGFVGEQGKIAAALGGMDSKRSSGTYYTPLHLAELTVDIALENIEKPVHELKVFDPACGSGVFLVILFGRMVESLRRAENQIDAERRIQWARKVELQLKRLYGLDTNRTACQITCFSLYLALLEQLTPMDVEYLRRHSKTKKALHKLFADETSGNWNTIHHGNLFDDDVHVEPKTFDLLIGNPPWVEGKHQKDEKFLKWRSKDPPVRGPKKQIVHGFLWRGAEYLSDTGVGCMLCPASVLFSHLSNAFQEKWFSTVGVEKVVNFSDLRFVLFAGAVHPCVAIRFRASAPRLDERIVWYGPKVDRRSQQGGEVYIREEDASQVWLADVMRNARNDEVSIAWKLHFWASLRDRRLLERLRDLPQLGDYAGEEKEGKRWQKGQGVKLKGGKPELGWWSPSTPYLDYGRACDLCTSESDFQTVEEANIPAKVARPRARSLFKGPKVLVSQGGERAVFCRRTCVFLNCFTTITGKQSDAENLRLLSAVLGADLVYYYLWHTSANLGIARTQVMTKEYLSVPFFLPEDSSDPAKAREIRGEIASILRGYEKRLETRGWFGREEETSRVRREVLEPLVRQYYGINEYEEILLEDTLSLAAKSSHPREGDIDVPTLRNPKDKDCRVYAQTLCKMLNGFGQGSGFKVNGEIIKGEPYSVVRLWLADVIIRDVEVAAAQKRLEGTFRRMEELLQRRKDGFVFCQNLKVFDGNDLYVLKPMQMRFWSRTAALNDADEIAGAILDSRESR